MQKIIFIILFVLIAVHYCFSQEYWIRMPSPTTKQLLRCHIIDTVYGWACGDSGAIINTSNGGASWNVQNSGITNYYIDDIFFTSRYNGWALSNDYLFTGTMILRTSNSGQNWTMTRFPDTSVVLYTVYFLDSLTGFMGGSYPGRMFKTTNGGANWNECRIDTAFCNMLYLFPKNRISFLNAQTGYAVGGQIDIQGIVWRTTDSGNNWYTYCVTAEPLHAVKPINPNKIIATGGDFEYGSWTAISYTSGTTWNYDSTTCGGIGRDLAFRTPSELWIPCSFSGKWALNLDSGSLSSPWFCIDVPDSFHVYASQFVSPTHGWSFGTYGSIFKYNSAVIGINGNQHTLPMKSTLYQNYPNPFNPITRINYYIAKTTDVKITVYDLKGAEITAFNEGLKPSGHYFLEFNGSSIASGVYFYKIEAGEYIESKKMVILK